MNLSEYLRRIRCPACQWQGVWGPEQMLESLREMGMLRRATHPEPAMIIHLAEASAERMPCTTCHEIGLCFEPWSDDFDDVPAGRRCELCGRMIPGERLEIFPNATRCAGCQDKPAVAEHEDEFCPRCGAHVQLRLTSNGGVSRYRVCCPECGHKS